VAVSFRAEPQSRVIPSEGPKGRSRGILGRQGRGLYLDGNDSSTRCARSE